MAQRTRAKMEDQLQPLSLQIPLRSGPQTQQVQQLPNGFRFELNGVKMELTSTVTPERQMLNLSIDISSLQTRRPKR